jgi:hypothetical protein
LRLSSAPFGVSERAADLDVWAGGRTARIRRQDVSECIRKLRPEKMNRITDRAIKTPFQWNHGITVGMFSSTLDIAPSNVLWGNVRGYVSRTVNGERSRMSFLSVEESFRFHGVAEVPSVLEETAFFEASSVTKAATVITELYEWLSRVTIPSGVIGLVDLADPLHRVLGENLNGAMAADPKSFQLLGTIVDDLHDVIIGPPPLCEGLAKSVGEHATIRPIGNSGLIWLELGASVLQKKAIIKEKVAAWLWRAPKGRR